MHHPGNICVCLRAKKNSNQDFLLLQSEWQPLEQTFTRANNITELIRKKPKSSLEWVLQSSFDFIAEIEWFVGSQVSDQIQVARAYLSMMEVIVWWRKQIATSQILPYLIVCACCFLLGFTYPKVFQDPQILL